MCLRACVRAGEWTDRQVEGDGGNGGEGVEWSSGGVVEWLAVIGIHMW